MQSKIVFISFAFFLCLPTPLLTFWLCSERRLKLIFQHLPSFNNPLLSSENLFLKGQNVQSNFNRLDISLTFDIVSCSCPLIQFCVTISIFWFSPLVLFPFFWCANSMSPTNLPTSQTKQKKTTETWPVIDVWYRLMLTFTFFPYSLSFNPLQSNNQISIGKNSKDIFFILVLFDFFSF